jgi:hypothetical protein
MRKQIVVRIDNEKKKELYKMLARKGSNLQEFLENYIDSELEKYREELDQEKN